MSHHDDNPSRIQVDPKILIPMLGILIAPFIGFLYNAEVALGILTVSLVVVAWFSWTLAQQVAAPQARALRMGAMMNGVMAAAALILLAMRLA